MIEHETVSGTVYRMRIGPLDTAFFWVSDLERSVAWYRRVLGVEPGSRYGGWQVLTSDGPTFALHQGRGDHPSVNAVLAFSVEDLDAAIAALSGNGVTPLDQVTDTGVARFVTIEDPDGNHLQLIERR